MAGQYYHQGSPDSGHQSDDPSGGQYGCNDGVKEQDRLLPIANVSRIMKRALPASAKISKEAKETIQECVSEFISFITGEASDKCQREKRKTVNGDDLLWAMSTLGFEDYIEPLKLYLHKYRELEGEKSSIVKQGETNMGKEGSDVSLDGDNMPMQIQAALQQNTYGYTQFTKTAYQMPAQNASTSRVTSGRQLQGR